MTSNLKLTPTQNKAVKEYLFNHKDYAPYFMNLFKKEGIEGFYIGPKVFRPDKSWVSYLLTGFLLHNSFLYQNKNVLDMGSGSGIQGISCAIKGAKSVLMSDIRISAVKNIEKNIKIFDLNNRAKALQSNLFTKIKGKFDIIIFNHPFFPNKPISSTSRDIFSGAGLLKKFFSQLPLHTNGKTIIIMPFSHLAPPDNDPINFIVEYGYSYINLKKQNKYGKQSIYLFSKDEALISSLKSKIKL